LLILILWWLLHECGFRLQGLPADALLLGKSLLVDKGDPPIIVELKLGLIDEAFLVGSFEFEIVACSDVVVLVGIDTFQNMVLLEAKLDELIENSRVDGYLRKSNEDTACDPRQERCCVPSMLANISHSESLLRVCIQDGSHHIS